MSTPENRAYEADLLNAEMLRQSADAKARAEYMAAGGDNNQAAFPAYDRAIRNNNIEFNRRRLASARANGLDFDANQIAQHLRILEGEKT